MKPVIKFTFLVLLVGVLTFISCKKEYSCENCGGNPSGSTNKPPVANAGPDQVIILPTDSVSLDGRSSSDPDGSISSYLWTKISGPGSFNIIKPSDSTTKVKTLVTGIYQFELKVTDNGGLSTKDTMRVIVSVSGQPNRPPVANAGVDQTIILPNNTITLNGSGSTDLDNNITSYAWTKISGPSSFTISNATSMQTPVTNLVQGVYQFELKVKDAGALFSKDTMQVTVNPLPPPPTCNPGNRPLINAQLVPFGTLSQVKSGMAVASAGNKVLFAGGATGYPSIQSTRVDIYDFTTQSWSTAELSQARWGMTTAVLGNRIFFAGGQFPGGLLSSRVDIYDVSTNNWSIAELSESRLAIAAAAVGDKVFFAGGSNGGTEITGTATNKVDIYDQSTNTWSIATLSKARFGLAATTAGDKIYFAGGMPDYREGPVLNTIDVYDNTTGSWSVSTLNEPKACMASIFKNGKIYWAGGFVYYDPVNGSWANCQIEIKDINTQTSSFANLFQKNYDFSAFEKDNKIVYLPGLEPSNGILPAKFDVYDLMSDTWSIGQLNQNIYGKAIISVNNTIYVAGGTVNGVLSNQVWKLEF
jgi:hypothetical protein